ncbi:MAG TPA: hypothetical protein VIK76_05080 [Pyrinomonadaceae bacterium]
MAVLLEGGCRVAHMSEAAPQVEGSLISLRLLEFAPGRSPDFRNAENDEVLFRWVVVRWLSKESSSSSNQKRGFLSLLKKPSTLKTGEASRPV